jgi:hypothetical protein
VGRTSASSVESRPEAGLVPPYVRLLERELNATRIAELLGKQERIEREPEEHSDWRFAAMAADAGKMPL